MTLKSHVALESPCPMGRFVVLFWLQTGCGIWPGFPTWKGTRSFCHLSSWHFALCKLTTTLRVSLCVSLDTRNVITWRLHMGVIIFVNRSPIMLHRQNTVKARSFRDEFVALWIAIKIIELLIYKVHMFRIPCHGPSGQVLWQPQHGYQQIKTRKPAQEMQCVDLLSCCAW